MHHYHLAESLILSQFEHSKLTFGGIQKYKQPQQRIPRYLPCCVIEAVEAEMYAFFEPPALYPYLSLMNKDMIVSSYLFKGRPSKY